MVQSTSLQGFDGNDNANPHLIFNFSDLHCYSNIDWIPKYWARVSFSTLAMVLWTLIFQL